MKHKVWGGCVPPEAKGIVCFRAEILDIEQFYAQIRI